MTKERENDLVKRITRLEQRVESLEHHLGKRLMAAEELLADVLQRLSFFPAPATRAFAEEIATISQEVGEAIEVVEAAKVIEAIKAVKATTNRAEGGGRS